jgi:hypothetical protein
VIVLAFSVEKGPVTSNYFCKDVYEFHMRIPAYKLLG